LEKAAIEDPDLHGLVALTTELLQLCESQQTSCLKAMQTTATNRPPQGRRPALAAAAAGGKPLAN
jgi:hypothetical protein